MRRQKLIPSGPGRSRLDAAGLYPFPSPICPCISIECARVKEAACQRNELRLAGRCWRNDSDLSYIIIADLVATSWQTSAMKESQLAGITHVAVIQAETSATLAEGLATTESLVNEASRAGASVVVLPETWLPGYPAWIDVCTDTALWNHAPAKAVFERHAAESVDVSGADGVALSQISKQAGVVMIVGVVERISAGPGRGTLYNSLLTYGPDGTLLNHHRKLIPTYTERMLWGQGNADGLQAVDTSSGRIGGLICWEHWMPLARQAMHDSGEDIHIAAWPTVHEMHQVASRHYAFEGRCYVLAAGSLMRASMLPAELTPDPARVRSGDNFVVHGGSSIIGPDGAYVVEPVYDTAITLHAELDMGAIRREQMTLDVSGHYARRDCFEFSVLKS